VTSSASPASRDKKSCIAAIEHAEVFAHPAKRVNLLSGGSANTIFIMKIASKLTREFSLFPRVKLSDSI
jgi:hypothetical protein